VRERVGHDGPVTQQLQHLAGAYFHQDYELDSESPDAVIDLFVRGEGAASAAELAWEIDRLLNSPLTEREISDLWVSAWGASYDPRDGGQDLRIWVSAVRNRLLDPAPQSTAPACELTPSTQHLSKCL
jgi:hypothetical protein